jgi:hypothetical protein
MRWRVGVKVPVRVLFGRRSSLEAMSGTPRNFIFTQGEVEMLPVEAMTDFRESYDDDRTITSSPIPVLIGLHG